MQSEISWQLLAVAYDSKLLAVGHWPLTGGKKPEHSETEICTSDCSTRSNRFARTVWLGSVGCGDMDVHAQMNLP